MAVKKGLSINLGPALKQKLNPSLFQQLKLLNLNYLDLINSINTIIEENPFIEIDTNGDNIENKNEEKKDQEGTEETNIEEAELGIDVETLEDFFESVEDISFYSKRKEKEENLIEKLLPSRESAYDRIKFRVRFELDDPKSLIISDFIIDNLDERGLLVLNNDDIKNFIEENKKKGVEISFEEFENIREKIKKIEPYGLASYTIKEVLITQAELINLKHKELIKKIIEKNLEDLAQKNYKKLIDEYNISQQIINEVIEEIKRLQPYPIESISDKKTEYIVPDAFIIEEEGELNVYLNDENLPKPQLNRYYKNIIADYKWKRGKDAKFLKAKFEEALNFIKAYDYRNNSLYKVVKAIADIQRDFFYKGTEYLKPLKLKDIVEVTELHETTISRIVSNKYVLTPSGLFSLKFFFSSSLKTKSGDFISSSSIKEKIKKMIEKEDKSKPLSDAEIAQILDKQGIKIKRRTIAKYREAIGIPSSIKRKIKGEVKNEF